MYCLIYEAARFTFGGLGGRLEFKRSNNFLFPNSPDRSCYLVTGKRRFCYRLEAQNMNDGASARCTTCWRETTSSLRKDDWKPT